MHEIKLIELQTEVEKSTDITGKCNTPLLKINKQEHESAQELQKPIELEQFSN